MKNLFGIAGLSILDKYKNTNVRRYYTLLNNSLNWSRDQLIAYQVKRISELLIYSNENVPFYTRRFNEAGFNPERFRYLDDLEQIPILTRSDIKQYLSELTSKKIDLRTCSIGSSSGSTGDPVKYYQNNASFSANRAATIFGRMLGGFKLGECWLNIWGNPTAVNKEWKKLSSRISKVVFNELRFPAYTLSNPQQLKALTDLILRKKPLYIYGYTNAIYLLSEYLREHSIQFNFIKGVFTTAENLHNYQRASIEKSIGRVFDQYGSSEINGVAVQTTNSNNYVVLSPHVYVEFGEDADPENTSRKLILTCLDNFIMPFIRYEIGDYATPSVSTEYNNFPFQLFNSVDGRESDLIKLPDGGSLVVPSFFGTRLLKNVEGILQYQVVRKKLDLIEVHLSVNTNFKAKEENIIKDALSEYLPASMNFSIVLRDNIATNKNGKFKLFIDETTK